MTTVVAQFITITCDSPECQNTVTFAGQNEQAQADAMQENPWMASLRFVNMPDQRKLGYCSDKCEAEGIKTGAHNALEQKKVITNGNMAQAALAARAAEQARVATESLKQGSGVTLG